MIELEIDLGLYSTKALQKLSLEKCIFRLLEDLLYSFAFQYLRSLSRRVSFKAFDVRGHYLSLSEEN